jgi:hypothetical protein
MPSSRLRIVIAVGVCVLTSPIVGFAEPGPEAPANAAASGAPDAATPARAGSWIHVDPQTGKRVARPAASAAIAADPAFSTSHQGLVEQPAPGGGMMLNLQGRFRSAASATVGADGRAHIECVPPGTAARKE